MAKFFNVLGLTFVLLVIFSQSAFAARKLQMNNGFNANVAYNNNNNNYNNDINENDNKNNENVVYATREGPSGDHAKGFTDNKNFVYGGVGSYGGIGSGVGVVGPLGGVGFGSGIGVASGIGGVGLLPAGGIGGVGGVGGVGGGVGGGLGGIGP